MSADEETSVALAIILQQNWIYIEAMIRSWTGKVLSKRQAIATLRRALDLMEHE